MLDIRGDNRFTAEPSEYGSLYPDCDINLADINGDGSVDALDIEGFLNLLFP